jgi:hypothetical protein
LICHPTVSLRLCAFASIPMTPVPLLTELGNYFGWVVGARLIKVPSGTAERFFRPGRDLAVSG